jgi:DNA-binding transcriptional MerR regulator
MSIPENVTNSDDLAVSATPEEIPDKLYFRIGEVARLAGIKPYVLRFWETEFNGLGPKKSGTGHRLYRRKDVELVLEIKRLLYEQRFTIEGARKLLDGRPKLELAAVTSTKSVAKGKEKKSARTPGVQAALFADHTPLLESVCQELRELLSILR